MPNRKTKTNHIPGHQPSPDNRCIVCHQNLSSLAGLARPCPAFENLVSPPHHEEALEEDFSGEYLSSPTEKKILQPAVTMPQIPPLEIHFLGAYGGTPFS